MLNSFFQVDFTAGKIHGLQTAQTDLRFRGAAAFGVPVEIKNKPAVIFRFVRLHRVVDVFAVPQNQLLIVPGFLAQPESRFQPECRRGKFRGVFAEGDTLRHFQRTSPDREILTAGFSHDPCCAAQLRRISAALAVDVPAGKIPLGDRMFRRIERDRCQQNQ